MKPKNFDINELKLNLLNTSKTLDDAMLELYALNSRALKVEHLKSINEDLFCCRNCYHWCEKSEESETRERICLDCVDEDED